MRLGMMLVQEQKLAQRLKKEQKQSLKQLQTLHLQLRSPFNEGAIKGFEGMCVADELLKERGGVGLLIGGLSDAVWNQRRKKEHLAKHKDVDVAILNDNFYLKKDFEEGIDWWVKKTSKVDYKGEYGGVLGNFQYFVNGNNVVLNFGISGGQRISPGLYIPSPEFVTSMRMNEANLLSDRISRQTRGRIDVDEDVLEKFERDLEKKIGAALPKFIRKRFRDQIDDPKYIGNMQSCMGFYSDPINDQHVLAIYQHFSKSE